MNVMPLLVVWFCLGAVMLGYALYATVTELRTPRDRALAGGSPLNAPAGQGFLLRPGIRPTDGTTRRLGKCLTCIGWYFLAIALLGIAVVGFVGFDETLPRLLTTNFGSAAIVLLLIGSLLRIIGARTERGDL
jgi:hypothetical protein